MTRYTDKQTNKSFDSMEDYIKFIEENNFDGTRLFNKTEYHTEKKEEWITKMTLCMINCSEIQLIKLGDNLVLALEAQLKSLKSKS